MKMLVAGATDAIGDPAFATLLVMTAWAEGDAGIRENRTLKTDARFATPFDSAFETQGKHGKPFDSSRDSPFEAPFGTQGKQGKRGGAPKKPEKADPSPAPQRAQHRRLVGDPAFAALLVMTAWAGEFRMRPSLMQACTSGQLILEQFPRRRPMLCGALS